MYKPTKEELCKLLDTTIFRKISETADELGVECYVVGGYVRDIFLERPSTDIDVVVVGKGIEMARAFSKKLGKAHIRNRVRRRLREVYRLNEERFMPGWDIVLVARSRAVEAPFDKLTASCLSLAKKAGILREDAL